MRRSAGCTRSPPGSRWSTRSWAGCEGVTSVYLVSRRPARRWSTRAPAPRPRPCATPSPPRGSARTTWRWIVLTHVHLDHCGATGILARPSRGRGWWSTGAAPATSPSPAAGGGLGGGLRRPLVALRRPRPPPRPTASAPSRTATASRSAPGRDLVMLETLGHARHHMCVHDEATGTVLAGDAVGVRFPGAASTRRCRRRTSTWTPATAASPCLAALAPTAPVPRALRPRPRPAGDDRPRARPAGAGRARRPRAATAAGRREGAIAAELGRALPLEPAVAATRPSWRAGEVCGWARRATSTAWRHGRQTPSRAGRPGEGRCRRSRGADGEGAPAEALLVRLPGSLWALPGVAGAGGATLEAAALAALAEQTGRERGRAGAALHVRPRRRRGRGRGLPRADRRRAAPARPPAPAWSRCAGSRWTTCPPSIPTRPRCWPYGHQRLRAKAAYAPIAFQLLPEAFTLGELQIGLRGGSRARPRHAQLPPRRAGRRGGRARRTAAPRRARAGRARLYRFTRRRVPGAGAANGASPGPCGRHSRRRRSGGW